MEVLHRISSLAGRSNDPQAAIAEILSAAMQTLGADAGHVALHNPNSGLLEVEVEHGLPAESHDVAFRPGQGITGWVGLHGRPRVVEDVADEPRYISIRPATRALVAAPISAEGGQVLGVLCLHSNRAGRFGPEDGERLSRLTAEASAVMRRLWELGHLRAKAKQLEALISIAQSLVTKLTPEELYEGITRNALLVTKARACALYLHDADARTLRCATLSAETEIAAPEGDMPLGSCLNAAVVATRRQAEFQNIHSPDYEDLVDLPRDDKIQSVLATPVLSGGEVLGVLTVFTEVVHRFDNDEKRLCDALGRLAAVTLENARL
jgi:GAF domain-containing protein